MKKKIIVLIVVVVSLSIGWVLWNQNKVSPHKVINIKEVLDIRFGGPAIKNNDGYRDATDRESEKIVQWFNSIEKVHVSQRPIDNRLPGILIQLNPNKIHDGWITEMGETIWIVKSQDLILIERGKNGSVSYAVTQPEIQSFLDELSKP